MISQLNARLISSRVHMTTPSISTSGYASSGSDRSRSSGRSSDSKTNVNLNPVPNAVESMSTGSSHGYAADRSAQPSIPSHSNGSESMKRLNDMAGVTSFQPALKRLRTSYNDAELNYLASKAKEVIEQAGLVYPKLQTSAPRLFPPKSGVNMSSVTHKYSSECDSPFLVDNNRVDNHYMGCPYEMTSLLQSTSSYYSLAMDDVALPASFSKVVQMIQRNNLLNATLDNCFEKETFSDTESSTSSVTVSDVGGVNCQHTSSLKHSDCNASDPLRPSSTNSLTNGASNKDQPIVTASAIITIGTALEISRRPRIIASAQAPYNVVQVNAAFLRLSQSKSTSDFLGKPLQDVLQMQCNNNDNTTMNHNINSLAMGLKTCNTTMQKVSVPGYPNLLRNSSNATDAVVHRISIIPVGVPPKPDATIGGKVTHFAIKFSIQSSQERLRPASTSSSSSSLLSNVAGNQNNRNQTSNCTHSAIHVMG